MPANSKVRLDKLVVEQGLATSRAQAQALIMAGKIMDINRQLLTKAGQQVSADTVLQLKEKLHPWVSRGGIKLDYAIKQFNIELSANIVADIGASTGGFTDVLLHYGAAKIYAVDVGYGQLADKLRNDSRVIVLEKTNARYLSSKHIPQPLDGVVCDASFISLKLVLPKAMQLVKQRGWLVALIKPQFEVGKGCVGKGGVVSDENLHLQVCDEIAKWCNEQPYWSVHEIIDSPVAGAKGNKEFLLYATKNSKRNTL